MNAERYDLIVLGSGSAAGAGAGKAAQEHGARVALIEHWLWGGSCPNVACRPTKAYVVAAELMHDVRRHAPERGIDLPEPAIRLAQTRRWKDALRRDQQSWVQTLKEAGYAVVPGTAAFVDTQTVRVGEQELSGDRILVATGSRTAIPPISGIGDIEWIDHVSALELEEVPESLLVVGAGPVGLEFAQIFARFGSRVTIVNTGPQIAARADTEAAGELQAALEEEGIDIVLNSGVDSFALSGEGIDAAIGGRMVHVSHVLLATGRLPNVEELEPARIGLEVGRGGIGVDDRLRTNVDGIWAAGDVAAGPMLTPIAQYQARIAVEDMFGEGSRRADYSVLPTAIFTDAQRLDQVLKNLLSNAFKFTESGYVKLRMARVIRGWSADRASLNRARAVFAFSVSDSGIGIPLDEQSTIFEAFQQAEGSTNRRYGGIGLCLAWFHRWRWLVDRRGCMCRLRPPGRPLFWST